jgi:hypothetical protein
LVREIEYEGRLIGLTVLPEQGRWGYRIDNGPVRALNEIRAPMPEDDLFVEAEIAAKAEVDRLELRQRRLESAMERPEVRRRA